MNESLIQTSRAKILGARMIPAPHPEVLSEYKTQGKALTSFGLLTVDFDHALYVALDEATKASPITVIYSKSLYYNGEAIAMIAGSDDEIVREGMKAAVRALESSVSVHRTLNTNLPFFAHVVSRSGEYLAKEAQVPVGDSLAYLMGPPIESVVALDAALKASVTKITKLFAPPTETNRGGAFLTGDLEECNAAADAFRQAMADIDLYPVETLDRKHLR